MDMPTLSPCPVCGEEPGVGDLSFLTKIVWCDCRNGRPGGCLCGAGGTHADAAAAWNAAVASYRPPAPGPEPEPVTPRRWWWVSLATALGGWGGVAHFSGAFCGDTRVAAIDRAREEITARDDGHGAEWLHARTTANELTPAALAAMLAESRAWYARELERISEGVG